ncbi:MAG: 5-keto-L-gluconate epimerase [Candidatus Neomarinimicrobiota bacterium]
MKLSIVLSTQPASFSALAYKGRLAGNIAKIKSLGYDGVELAIRDPGSFDLSALNSLLTKHALPVPAIGTGQAFGEEGLSFIHPEASIRRKAIDRIKAHMSLADKLGSIVIIGLVRGKKGPDTSDDQAERWLRAAMTECASENRMVKLAIEPINRYETDLINTVASGLRLLDAIGLDNVGLLLDTFHMNIEEPSLIGSMIAARERLFHFHIADSNRWYPGAGHIDFAEICNTLSSIGYQGFVSAEILPLPDPDTAAKKTVEYMRGLAS